MTSRNLTSKSPNPEQYSNSSDSSDPFNNVIELASFSSSNSDSKNNENKNLLDVRTPYMSSSASNLNPFGGSSTNINLSASTFDRYPQGLTGSRVVSTQSINSSTQFIPKNNVPGSRYSDSVSSVADSKHAFLVDAESSPFGGYPASSFPLTIDDKEDDDYLHNPDPIVDAEYENNRFKHDLKTMDKKSIAGLIGFLSLAIGMLAMFVVLPVLTYTGVADGGEIWKETYIKLTEYTYPQLSAIRTELVDSDTPEYAMTREAKDGSLWKLVFSDEFNAEGRTFYEGDDQFWYAPDFHYAATNDLEWYDPDAVTTANGTAKLRLDAYNNHNLYYRSGMLHSWNRMCFTQGVMEVSVQLPNYGNVSGLWPGAWSLGNLARPGYMATTEGVWPYTYDACDAGITANQSSPDGISYLPGQRLNSCTCDGEEHPNPGVGRGAPEIDIIEAEVNTEVRCGSASQSYQVAPYDIWYIPDYNWVEIHNHTHTAMNKYTGGPFQQAVSAVTILNTTWYERGDVGTERRFQKYAYEYLNDDVNGYIRWFVGDDPTFTLHAPALSPNGNTDWRRISKEPMSMIINLGISNNWAYIDWASIDFPSTMSIDYVRIYQPNDSVSITCDPHDYPTSDYIEAHPNAYKNNNHTTWDMAGYSFPKNRLIDGC